MSAYLWFGLTLTLLVGAALVVAAIADRARGRRIERDLIEQASERKSAAPTSSADPPGEATRREPRLPDPEPPQE